MAKVGRPPIDWQSFPVQGEVMGATEAAAFLGMKINTLHRQLIRDRGRCVTDGHAVKQPNGRWHIRPSIREAFNQKVNHVDLAD